MGWGWSRMLAVWALLGALLVESFCGACDMQSCSNNFASSTSGVRRGPHRPYCLHLRQYMQCVQGQAKACHGDLMYHGTKISVETLMADNSCEDVLARGDAEGDLFSMERTPLPSSHDDPCGYKSSPSNLAHCGLFGDPHLKTFNGTFMTCRVKGAWPMLSSSYLAIQVTNEAVAPNFKATATTKVTVLIKSQENCGSAKTYEASGDRLPKAFVDGTTFSGPDKSRPFAEVTESQSGLHVVIRVRSIDAVVSIRKIERYLSVSVTLPEEMVQELKEDMQLCIGGCPRSEQLRDDSVDGPLPLVMSEDKALAYCLEHNLTDYYLDSCVFDLVTTGDLSFREAAALSLRDLWKDDPKAPFSALRNCSKWPCIWKVTSGQGQMTSNLSVLGLTVALGLTLKVLMLVRASPPPKYRLALIER